jgi:hypothetical protein
MTRRRPLEGATYLPGDYANVPALHRARPFRVRYCPHWPQFNVPSIQARPNLEHLIVTGVGWMLAFGPWRRKTRKRKKAGTGSRPPTATAASTAGTKRQGLERSRRQTIRRAGPD